MFPDCDIWELAHTLARWIATHMALENIRFGVQRPGSVKLIPHSIGIAMACDCY